MTTLGRASKTISLALSAAIAFGCTIGPASSRGGSSVRVQSGALTAVLNKDEHGMIRSYSVRGQDRICNPQRMRTDRRYVQSCCPELRRAYTRLANEVFQRLKHPLGWTGTVRMCLSTEVPRSGGSSYTPPDHPDNPGGGNDNTGPGSPGGDPGPGGPGGGGPGGPGGPDGNGGAGPGGGGAGPGGGGPGGGGPGGPG